MNNLRSVRIPIGILSVALMAGSAGAQSIRSISTFAHGIAVQATGPDSITVGGGFVWVAYTNGADSTGCCGGKSTIVQYDLKGNIQHQFSIAGSVDGLKRDPATGIIWAMQNQDGNSTLSLINPHTETVTGPFQYAAKSAIHGYDDIVFLGGKKYLSYTNPSLPTDPTIQLLVNGSNPLQVTPILTMGATGTDLATGKAHQLTTQNDPDSLKLTPDGDLMLTSGDDGQLIFVERPGTPQQSVSFLNVLDQTGNKTSGLDDAVFATAQQGTFYLADTNNNQVLKIEADNLPLGSLYASVGSLNYFAKIDQKTGRVTPLLTSVSGPHGLVFVPQNNGDDGGNDNQQGQNKNDQ
jgi:hypothetical protein